MEREWDLRGGVPLEGLRRMPPEEGAFWTWRLGDGMRVEYAQTRKESGLTRDRKTVGRRTGQGWTWAGRGGQRESGVGINIK